jgi:hypothetical protein
MEIKTTDVNGRKTTFAELEIDWNGKKEIIRLKKLSFGEMLDLNQTSAKMSMVGGVAKFDLDQKAMSENSLLKSIIFAPFPINNQSIRDLDNELGQELLTVFNDLNTPSATKKGTSVGASETEAVTPKSKAK